MNGGGDGIEWAARQRRRLSAKCLLPDKNQPTAPMLLSLELWKDHKVRLIQNII